VLSSELTHFQAIVPVILCGGSGTRLWPLSRKSFPKQFVPLIGDKSLLTLTATRAARLNGSKVIAVGSEDHRFLIGQCMEEAGVTGSILLEPAPRNTAMAMAVAAVYAAGNLAGTRKTNADQDFFNKSDLDPLLLFCPADHHIPDTDAFIDCIRSGVKAADSGFIVTFGVMPTHPSSAYGYIRTGEQIDAHASSASEFIEKPNVDLAQKLLLEGDAFWNAGIFLSRASILLDALQLHAPDILGAAKASMQNVNTEKTIEDNFFIRFDKEIFEAARSESIDYAVMEKHDQVAVVPFKGQWSDVGSWNAVAQLTSADANQNRIEGQGVAHRTENTFIHAPSRPVVALGVSDLLIIDTADAVLIAHQESAEKVREVVAQLDSQGMEEAHTHRRVARPWGWYDSISKGDGFQVKRISIKPKASLSLQMHHHRAEHWIVVKGGCRGDLR
jgi:mannose-1-phosphate guanylyltransferase/mannose-6-phosphate isomerase